ncbi:MAG: amino acid transporter substrate-binding protein family [Candidatus Eremiobacteraeota bacterium]|nr:amino acid transporter substrate-binding protein family [Candidatus Eremiobacteraeota bacterium]
MNLTRRTVLAAALTLTATLVLGSSVASRAADDNSLDAIKKRGTIKIGVKYDAPPFGSLNPQTNAVTGFDVDIARAIAKKIFGSPDKVELVQVKSDNRIPLVQNGDIDAFVATATITPARMKTIDFSNVYYRAGQSLLVKKGSAVKSYRDLDGKSVCSVQGTTPEQTIRRLVPKANVVTFETYPECLTALRGGRVDAVTTDNVILGGFEAQDPTQLELVGGLFTFEPYGIGIRKGNTTLARAINDTLADLKKSGEYAKLHQQWLKRSVPADFDKWYGMPAETAAEQFNNQKPG